MPKWFPVLDKYSKKQSELKKIICDIAERWRQHIKRGIGADPPTQNKLYPAMLAEGVENFTFEIIEECPAAKLTEREKYYTDIFAAQSYGYVVRKG